MPSPLTFQFAYSPDLDVFTARRLTSHSHSTERHGYEAVLQALKALGTPHWLLAVRRRVTTDWLPRAAALLLPARLRPVMAAAYAAGPPFALHTFTDEEAALAWLLARPEEPGLLMAATRPGRKPLAGSAGLSTLA